MKKWKMYSQLSAGPFSWLDSLSIGSLNCGNSVICSDSPKSIRRGRGKSILAVTLVTCITSRQNNTGARRQLATSTGSRETFRRVFSTRVFYSRAKKSDTKLSVKMIKHKRRSLPPFLLRCKTSCSLSSPLSLSLFPSSFFLLAFDRLCSGDLLG